MSGILSYHTLVFAVRAKNALAGRGAWLWGKVVPPTTHEIKNAIKTVRVNGSNGCRCRYLPSCLHTLFPSLSLLISLAVWRKENWKSRKVEKENLELLPCCYGSGWPENLGLSALPEIQYIRGIRCLIWEDNVESIWYKYVRSWSR